MSEKNRFLTTLGFPLMRKKDLNTLAGIVNIPVSKLNYYNQHNILPDLTDLAKIEMKLSINKFQLMIGMGIYDRQLEKILRINRDAIAPILQNSILYGGDKKSISEPIFVTSYGRLYKGDCIEVMQGLDHESVDLIFADPPFNLNKFYLSGINDSLDEFDYLEWSERWIDQCIRILKPGGTFYLWNLPKWNTFLSDYLNKRLTFKHWIATDIKYTLPISGRLYPSHYSLLMYTKGNKPNTFHPDRLPMEICNSCFKEVKDYGGYKDKMNPKGINLSDVWYDIPPVRHKKYKARVEANELSVKLIDRIIEISSNINDVVFDPFGGSGTTFIVSEIKERKWIGSELGPVEGIIERFHKIEEERKFVQEIRAPYNKLFPDQVKRERKKRGIWTDDTFTNQNEQAILFNEQI
jgi:site-specific DNA-methyltransferase (adenine-specific)